MLPKADVKLEFTKGKGPGGQHKNKVETMVRATHVPTGIVVTVDGRHRHRNIKQALAELERRIRESKLSQQAAHKKANRDAKIHDRTVVRTYDYSRGVVKDHRTGKTASLKQIVGKGKLDLLRDDDD
jgi:peptide chain release factor 1